MRDPSGLPVCPDLTTARKPSILLCTGWQSTNIGDEAFTPAMLHLLEKHVPEAEVVVWGKQLSAETLELVGERWPEARFVSGEIDSKGEEIPEELRAAFAGTDLFLYNSGQVLNYGYYSESWDPSLHAALPLLYCRDIGKPYGLYAQSFDLFAQPSPVFYRGIFQNAAFAFARESESIDYLREQQLLAPVTRFAPDAAFGFDLFDDEAAEVFLRRTGLEDGKFLGVILRTVSRQMEAAGLRDLFLEKMREIVVRWIRETGLPVLLCPEQQREISPVGPLFIEKLPADVRSRVFARESWWGPDEARSVYARARALVGMEPHSLIMALTAGVPALHAYYAGFGRKAQMYRDIGLGDWLFDLESVSPKAMGDVLLGVHQNREIARERVASAMTIVREAEREAMGVVRGICGLPQVRG